MVKAVGRPRGIPTIVASVPFQQAACTFVKGYEHWHGYKIRFETTWLEKL
jgi:hypothetical protein